MAKSPFLHPKWLVFPNPQGQGMHTGFGSGSECAFSNGHGPAWSTSEATAPAPAMLVTALRHALVCHVPGEPDPKSDKHSSDTGSPLAGGMGDPKATPPK